MHRVDIGTINIYSLTYDNILEYFEEKEFFRFFDWSRTIRETIAKDSKDLIADRQINKGRIKPKLLEMVGDSNVYYGFVIQRFRVDFYIEFQTEDEALLFKMKL